MDFRQLIETTGQYLDFVGVAVMVIGAVVSSPLAFLGNLSGDKGSPGTYRSYRQRLGRSILLGLELLVAADISDRGRHTDLRQRGRTCGHRHHPDVPELLPRIGDHRALAVAKRQRARHPAGGLTGSLPRLVSTPVNFTSTGSVKRRPLTSSWRMNVGGSTWTCKV